MNVDLLPADTANPGFVHPKGIRPALLLAQVKNTAPYLFEPGGEALFPEFRKYALSGAPQSIPEYFTLNLVCHHASVATFVPTDVDAAIRSKLWLSDLDPRDREKMVARVLESREWDTTRVSTRWLMEPESQELLSGHHGEWFSTAAAAYGATLRSNASLAAEVAGEILREVQREAGIAAAYFRRLEAIPAMIASTLIAHNLGDLIRVFEAWDLDATDPLWEAVNKNTASGSLATAGEINRRWMANENHRHFALRSPRGLRRSPDLLLPIGPFFDRWGEIIARHPALEPKDLAEILEALIQGPKRLLAPSVGYSRALHGIESTYPGGLEALCDLLPSRVAKEFKTGEVRMQCSIDRERFEARWSRAVIKYLKERK